MISISLCMIVKNVEDILARCLASVKELVDEIVIVDTGSTDGTKKTAAQYTDKIFDFVWQDDFAAARNFAFRKGSKDYLMWLDADDVIPVKEAEKFREMKKSISENVDVIMMPYAAAFDESGNSIFTYYRERIVRNGAGYMFKGRIHEVIPPSGKIFYSDIQVEHRKAKAGDSGRNLRIYENMKLQGEAFDSRDLYYYGRELMFHRMYKKGAEVLEDFLQRTDGWVENRIDATRQLAACYYAIGEDEKAFSSLTRAFAFDVPRGETCCDIGRHFMDRGKYKQAVYWYTQALSAKKATKFGAFLEEERYGFLPAISLCICYDRMGDREQAYQYNELAGSYKPESPYYLKNREYFSYIQGEIREFGQKRAADGQKQNPNI